MNVGWVEQSETHHLRRWASCVGPTQELETMTRIALPVLLLAALMPTALVANPQTCSYDTYQWSTLEKRAVNRQTVVHPYREVTEAERDPITGCTVCREDQVELALPGLKPFKVCKVVAAKVETSLRDLMDAGVPIKTVIGYRVGRTRGEVDNNGLRTGFSNHSYGVAIDINSEHNGLYDRCMRFNPDCRLIRGGPWQPYADAESLSPGGEVVQRLKQAGFLWGGEIQGRQKDFMHFSPSGY